MSVNTPPTPKFSWAPCTSKRGFPNFYLWDTELEERVYVYHELIPFEKQLHSRYLQNSTIFNVCGGELYLT